jgi:hypothetical protein
MNFLNIDSTVNSQADSGSWSLGLSENSLFTVISLKIIKN